MRGLLEALILDSIAREPKHGYALLRELEQAFGAPPNRNQVYPMLNRLEKEGVLQADRAEGRGKTRYHLTGKGLELLKDYRVRTPLFLERVGALWQLPSAEPVAAPATPEARDPGPRFRVAEAQGPAPPHGPDCALEVVLRKQPGAGKVALELVGLDPTCPTCAPWAELLRRAADAFP
ncbi:MAG: PadR family transcriptional regulator [Halobacteriales archaeon]|nr:PadR family transcriptional regulator [Halobacteriales archaeon]